MNIAFRHNVAGRSEAAAGERPTGVHLARIDIYSDLAEAEPAWRRLEAAHALASPYQRYEWIELWHRHVSGPEGAVPMIVVGRDDYDTPLFLLPFAKRKHGAVSIAGYFGGRHASLNTGLWRRDIASAMTADVLRDVLSQVAGTHAIDVFALLSQPLRIGPVANPFALLPRQRSPDDVYVANFAGRAGDLELKHCVTPAMRRRLRGKKRKLMQLGGYRYTVAASAADVDRTLDTFLAQKAAHFAAQGIDNVFARPEITSFVREACHSGLAEGRPVIELHALEAGGEVIAVFGGTSNGRRLSFMFNSYTIGDSGRWSPGLVLLTHLIAHSADRRLTSIDLGAGFARYKTFFCKSTEGLFDNYIAFSAMGRAAALALATTHGLKRWVKGNPLLEGLARRLLKRRVG